MSVQVRMLCFFACMCACVRVFVYVFVYAFCVCWCVCVRVCFLSFIPLSGVLESNCPLGVMLLYFGPKSAGPSTYSCNYDTKTKNK